uniref:N-terminal Xaa-Pro-Lys N-methyltransferase 1-A-like n=1 Tax=Styela clava TaxID=7725 RepID=UPI001939F55A|nr:N-terminal Xaa-Pro-Lys N-methyltransferase 1-A-like [Styela clava]
MDLIKGCKEVSSEQSFYEEADKYWKTISPTLDGMLGGYSHISTSDVLGSRKFLREFLQGSNPRLRHKRALDCGAGIGRVSKLFLLHIFDTVDLLEQNGEFLKQAPSYLGPELSKKVGEYICAGLQDVNLKPNFYDLIWVQWVTGHLTDAHFIEFLHKCQNALLPGGLLILKDNISSGDVEWDKVDSSVTRTHAQLRRIFKQAGMKIVKEEHQTNFPAELYKVFMFALSKEDS